MSRAFVKESNGSELDDLPELPLSPHPNYVTARGLQQLRERLDAVRLRLEQNPGDAAAAREQRWLQARLAAAIPVLREPPYPQAVAFGATVELADENGRHYRYRIVGEDEAAPEQGLLAWTAPLARALEGARPGDWVGWPRPAGDLEVQLLGLDYGGG